MAAKITITLDPKQQFDLLRAAVIAERDASVTVRDDTNTDPAVRHTERQNAAELNELIKALS